MCLATLFYSLTPVSLALASQDGSSAWSVSAGLTIGVVASSLMFLVCQGATRASFKTVQHMFATLKTETQRGGGWQIVFMGCAVLFSRLDFTFFILSTSYVDTAVSSSLFEIWPVLCFLALRHGDYLQGERSNIPAQVYALMAAGCLPVIAIVMSINGDKTQKIGWPVLGIMLALLAPCLSGGSAFQFYFSKKAANMSCSHFSEATSAPKADLACNLMIYALTAVLPLPLLFLLAFFQERSLTAMFAPLLSGVIVGLLVLGTAAMFWRKANIGTTRRELQAIQYASPVLSLVWLAAIVGVDVPRLDLLLGGALSIVVINCWLHFVVNKHETKTKLLR